MDLAFVILLSILIFLISWFIGRVWKKSPLSHIPGPKGLPFVGSAFSLGKARRLDIACTQWTKEFGPVVKVTVMGKTMVTVNDFDTIYECLVKRGNDFAGRPQQKNFRSEFMASFKGLAFSDPTPLWKLLRKTSHSKLKMFETGLSRIEAVTVDICKLMVTSFGSHNSQPFDPRMDVYLMTFNIMTMLTMGKIFPADSKEVRMFVEMETTGSRVLSPIFILNIMPFLRFFNVQAYKDLVLFVEQRKELYETMKRVIREDPEAISDGILGGLVSLLDEDNEMRKKHAKQNQLKDIEIDDLDIEVGFVGVLIAGVATTSRIAYVLFNILAQHQDIQKKLQEEADDVVGTERIVTLKDKQRMPYTQATVLELLRFASVVPFNLPHCALTDSQLGGLRIPKGTELLINVASLHHDPDFWDNPSEFRPERFLDDDGNIVSASHPNRKHLMAFGAGPRVCLGEQMALSRLFLVLTVVCQIFNFKCGSDKVPYRHETYTNMNVLDPLPFKIIAEERNQILYTQMTNE